jgi:hypothetical protein
MRNFEITKEKLIKNGWIFKETDPFYKTIIWVKEEHMNDIGHIFPTFVYNPSDKTVSYQNGYNIPTRIKKTVLTMKDLNQFYNVLK